jgi:hypothetical protein
MFGSLGKAAVWSAVAGAAIAACAGIFFSGYSVGYSQAWEDIETRWPSLYEAAIQYQKDHPRQ